MRTSPEIRHVLRSPSQNAQPNQEQATTGSQYEPESQFDQFPETIPETQFSLEQSKPATPPAVLNRRVSSRSFHTMMWKPSGAMVRLDLNLQLDEILETLQDISLEDGVGEIQGFHYSLNGGSECIVTMPDEFDSFRMRVNHLGKGARIVIRPVDPLVSYAQYSSC